jgi:hypothetical protein
MNAFTRQEITAITPQRRAARWSRASDDIAGLRYRPVADVATGDIAAYQAMAYKTGKHSLPEQIELLIDNSPQGKPLLLALDPQQWMEEEHASDNAVLQALQQYLWSDLELIVCLQHAADEAWRSLEIYKQLQQAGIPTVVDAHAPWDASSLNVLVDANTLQFSASRLPACITQLLGLAREMGIRTLLTEVSSKAQAAWAARLGFDWILRSRSAGAY